MKLNRFYYAQSKDERGNIDNLVLDTQTLNIGRILFYKSHAEMLHKVNNSDNIAIAPVRHYNIAVFFGGNLGTGSRINAKPSIVEDLRINMQQMGEWFYSFKIVEKEKYYNKHYAIENNP